MINDDQVILTIYIFYDIERSKFSRCYEVIVNSQILITIIMNIKDATIAIVAADDQTVNLRFECNILDNGLSVAATDSKRLAAAGSRNFRLR